MKTISAFCLEWHLSKSGAFQYALVDALQDYVDIQLQAWDGNSLPSTDLNNEPYVFCQLPPPPDLLAIPQTKLIWLPMWDQAWNYPQAWWNALPKSLRIVAFSEAIARRAQAAGLPTLQLRYFQDPAHCKPANWQHGRVLMYWNRKGMIGPGFLEKLCGTLKIDKLFFREKIDPRYTTRAAYSLPPRLGQTVVEELPGFMPRAEYLNILQQTNIFIAPRLREGLGMIFVEALAQGCAVFGFDAPTMNEYITHGEDGYLWRSLQPTMKNRLLLKVDRFTRRGLSRLGINRSNHFEHPVTEYQDWQAMAALDLKKLGDTALRRHQTGFTRWRQAIPDYASFVLEW